MILDSSSQPNKAKDDSDLVPVSAKPKNSLSKHFDRESLGKGSKQKQNPFLQPSSNSLDSQFSFENMKGIEFSVEQKKVKPIEIKPIESDRILISSFEAHLQLLAAENKINSHEEIV